MNRAFVLAAAAACAAPPPETTPEPQGCIVPLTGRSDLTPANTVYSIYLQALDTPDGEAAERRDWIDRSLAAIQGWYAEAMGAAHDFATFRFEPTLRLQSRFTAAEWDDFGRNGFPLAAGGRSNGCGIWYAAEDELNAGGLLAGAGFPPLFSPGSYYLAVGGGGTGGGCGAGGLAAVEAMLPDRVRARCPNGRYDGCTQACADASGLGDVDPWCDEALHAELDYACTAVGAFAHELGHGFGLPHGADRPACTGESLMDLWWEYDRGVTLCLEDRADLAASGYFAP